MYIVRTSTADKLIGLTIQDEVTRGSEITLYRDGIACRTFGVDYVRTLLRRRLLVQNSNITMILVEVSDG